MIQTEPVELRKSSTEPIVKYVHEDLVVDRIKSRTKIEQYQCGNETMGGGSHDFVVNNSDGGVCGVVLSIGRLTFRKKTVLSHMVIYTINNKALDYLRDEARI